MHCQRYWPSPSLQAYVAWFWTLEWSGELDISATYRLIPDGYVDWVFHLETPWGFTQAAGHDIRYYRSHLFGHSTNFLEIQLSSASTKVFGIKFQPWAAQQLWKTSMHSTTNTEVALSDLALPATKKLTEEITTAIDTQERISITEQYLYTHLTSKENLKAVVEQLRTNENCDIDSFGLRRLQQRFKSEIGISPKLYQRTLRINRVLQQMLSGTDKLTDLAYQNGYYDQSHFIRDFRTFTGLSPRAFLRSINPSEDFFNLRVH